MKKVAEEKLKTKPTAWQKHNTTREVLQNEASVAIEELLQENQQKFIQETLNAEVEEFLGRKCYEHSEQKKGYRNGSYPKKVLLPGTSIIVHKPHFRNVKEKFISRILGGIALLSDKLRMAALGMYVRGLSTRDIEATLRASNGKPMFSCSMLSLLPRTAV